MALLEKLIPNTKKEKNGAFICIVIALVIIALHNPFSGYQTDIEYDDYFRCENGSRGLTIDEKEYSCINGKKLIPLSVTHWRTLNSAITWLETLGNVLSLLSAVGGVYIAWIVLFREENSTENSS
jgi:cytosine/uracil/thiamine/allantoin permease